MSEVGHSRLFQPVLPAGSCPLRSESDLHPPLPRNDTMGQIADMLLLGRRASRTLRGSQANRVFVKNGYLTTANCLASRISARSPSASRAKRMSLRKYAAALSLSPTASAALAAP
jgi:hypothetical protein